MKTGALNVRGDYFIFMDVDSEISICLLGDYVFALKYVDIVVGSRVLGKGNSVFLRRAIGNGVMTSFISLLSAESRDLTDF